MLSWYFKLIFQMETKDIHYCETNKIIWLMQAVMQSSASEIIVSKNDCMIIYYHFYLMDTRTQKNRFASFSCSVRSSKITSCLSSVMDRPIDILWYLSLPCGNWYGGALVTCEYSVPLINKNNNKSNHIRNS